MNSSNSRDESSNMSVSSCYSCSGYKNDILLPFETSLKNDFSNSDYCDDESGSFPFLGLLARLDSESSAPYTDPDDPP
jgi:hypothetical protein